MRITAAFTPLAQLARKLPLRTQTDPFHQTFPIPGKLTHSFLPSFLRSPCPPEKMSSASDSSGGATPAQWYFCHQCKVTSNITPPIAADPICPICGGSFVEELEFPEPNPTPNPFFSIHSGAFNSSPGTVEIRNTGDLAGLLGLDSAPSRSQPPGNPGFDPHLFVRDHIQSIFSGGASIQVIFDGSGGNIGDYVHGSGLEHLIQQLFENDPNRYGPPPAAKSAVEALPVMQISEEMVAGADEAQCAVCKDVFEIGAEAIQMPCKHIYHRDCIVPWLELHNSCPVCRYELPTDDPDYVQRVARTPAAPGDFGGMLGSVMGGGEQRGLGRRSMHRRVRVSLPWPLRGLGPQAEWSGYGGGENDSSSSASRDENLEGRQISGAEPRQDDLD